MERKTFQAKASSFFNFNNYSNGTDVLTCSHCPKTGATPIGEFIFITSDSATETMKDITGVGDLFCHSCHDHQPWSTKKCNTLEAVCYDPQMGSVATLSTVHMTSDIEAHVSPALFHLKDILENSKKDFVPHCFVADEARGLRTALTRFIQEYQFHLTYFISSRMLHKSFRMPWGQHRTRSRSWSSPKNYSWLVTQLLLRLTSVNQVIYLVFAQTSMNSFLLF